MTDTSRAELEIARHLGYVEQEGADASVAAASDGAFATKVQEKYFLLLLVHLYERWFFVERPNHALENLVLHFQDREAIWLGDRMLPSRIAGIGASDEEATQIVGPRQYLQKMKMQEWLGAYVRAAIDHDAFGKRAL